MLFVGVNNFLADWHSFNSTELLSMATDYDNWLVANSYGSPFASIANLTDVQLLVASQNLSTFCTYLAQASTYHSTVSILLNNIPQSDFIQQLGSLATLMTNVVKVQFTESEIFTSLSHAGKATMWSYIISEAQNNQGLLAHYQTNNAQEFVKQCIIVLPLFIDSYITETVSQYLQKIKTYYTTEQYAALMAALTELYYTPSQTLQLAEWHIYGSSRVGVYKANKPLAVVEDEVITSISYQTRIKYRYNGKKQYELTNHLGNVLVTISDRRTAICNEVDSTLSYKAVVVTATDYYSFGSPMIGRTYEGDTSLKYRYGFNGKENDNEVKGNGNCIAFEARILDTRAGRWFSVDPLMKKYIGISTYSVCGNNPICFMDEGGRDIIPTDAFKNSAYYPVYLSLIAQNNTEFINIYKLYDNNEHTHDLVLHYSGLGKNKKSVGGKTDPGGSNHSTITMNSGYEVYPNGCNIGIFYEALKEKYGNNLICKADLNDIGRVQMLFHEMLHAQIFNFTDFSRTQVDPVGSSHRKMAETEYITKMNNFLTEANADNNWGLTSSDIKDLSFIGLDQDNCETFIDYISQNAGLKKGWENTADLATKAEFQKLYNESYKNWAQNVGNLIGNKKFIDRRNKEVKEIENNDKKVETN